MNLLNLEDVKFKTVTVNGHKFQIRFMSPLDRVSIAQRRMRLQDGQPLSAMSEEELLFFENIAIVDVCTEEMPKEFKEHQSCIYWEDISLINGLANDIRQHTLDIESKLKKNKSIAGSE